MTSNFLEPTSGAGQPAAAPEDDSTEKKDRLPDEPRMVYIGNLPFNIEWQDLKDHMNAAGTVEFAKILTYDGYDGGSTRGRSRGVAYVRYSTDEEATQAIATLNGTTLGEREIQVDAWTGSKPREGGGKGGWGKGGMKGGWGGKGAFGWGQGFGKGFGKGNDIKVHGEPDQMVFIGNLPWKAQWQDLKDHAKTAGTVEFCKILTEDGSAWGRSRGIGCVRFSSEEEAKKAIATLNGSEFMGRPITVDLWTRKSAAAEEAQALPSTDL